MNHVNGKITSRHLAKTAYLYIRQSTLRQVQENTESTLRQYALRDKLVSLGWDRDDIEVIDCDLGRSGKAADNREGFQQLVSCVTNGQAGAVACIEASRLSRCSGDWGRLVEYCAMTDTLLIDADGIYNPNDFNDRLLLGLKGAMSEAELHFLQERMRGGLLNKAKRGELKKPLPIGYLYDECDRIVKDSDMQVREAIALFFRTFRIVGTAHGMASYYKKKGYLFPRRVHKGYRKGELIWTELVNSRILDTLHNPVYAGIYHYGEKQTVWTKDGKRIRPMPKEDWHVFIKDHHEGYISYEDFEMNERILEENAHPRSEDGRRTPAREGPALLQGLVICGKCGSRMSIRYAVHTTTGLLIPHYMCQRKAVQHGGAPCQDIHGGAVDIGILELIKERLTPEAVGISVEIQKEVNRRKHEHSRYFELQVEKAKYEADIARRRYMCVDPGNRLVALELESAWNIRLKQLEDSERIYEAERKKDEVCPDDLLMSRVEELAETFSSIWDDPDTNAADKKRIIRYLVEDVTLLKETQLTRVQIRLKGGTTEEFKTANALRSSETWTTPAEVVEFLKQEGPSHSYAELADMLTYSGMHTGKNVKFSKQRVGYIMRQYGIPNIMDTYKAKGYIGTNEKAAQIGVNCTTLVKRVAAGKYEGTVIKTGKDLLFEP